MLSLRCLSALGWISPVCQIRVSTDFLPCAPWVRLGLGWSVDPAPHLAKFAPLILGEGSWALRAWVQASFGALQPPPVQADARGPSKGVSLVSSAVPEGRPLITNR